MTDEKVCIGCGGPVRYGEKCGSCAHPQDRGDVMTDDVAEHELLVSDLLSCREHLAEARAEVERFKKNDILFQDMVGDLDKQVEAAEARVTKAEAERDNLKHDIERHLTICNSMLAVVEAATNWFINRNTYHTEKLTEAVRAHQEQSNE